MAFQPPVPDQVNAANSSTALLVSLAVTGASYSGSSLVLTGAWAGGGSSAYVGLTFYVSGFTAAGVGNNSTNAGFVCTASSAGSITLTVVGGYNGFTGAPTAAQMFIGTAVDCTTSAISSVTVFAFSDQASSNAGFQVQWSQDNINWQDHIQRETNTANSSSIISDKPRARYFRAVYINGTTTQGIFRLQTILSATNTSGTIRDLDTLVSGDDEAQMVRAVLTGKAQPSTGTTFTDVITDVYGSLQVVVGGSAADAFGRLRIANPVTLFDSQFQYDTQPLLFQTSLVGSGSVAKTANESSLTLSTGGTTSGWGAVNQTKQYFRYEPGKSQQIVMTGVLGAKTSNVRSRIGYFDANDGVYFEQDGTAGISVNVRSSTSGSPVNTSVAQASWNFDTMDGKGPSGATVDFSKTQIFAIDFQWLGVGRVRFGFFVNGVLIVCHQIYNSNVITSPYMNTANLPCRAEIFNTGAAGGTTTMKQVCMTVVSEGGAEYPQAYQFSADNVLVGSVVNSTTVPVALLSISPALTFGGLANRATYKFTGGSLINAGNAVGKWALLFNPSLAGTPAFASVDPTSGMTLDVSATNIGGLVITAISTVGGVTTITWAGNSINGVSQGANNQWAGYSITVAGFGGGNTGNNGTFTITSSTGTTIKYPNGSGTSAGTGGGTTFKVPGISVASGYFQAANAGGGQITLPDLSRFNLNLAINLDGTQGDVYSLVALTAASVTVYGSLQWTEIR